MDESNIFALLLANGTTLIAQIEELSTELGEPDCLLKDPYQIMPDKTIQPWLIEYSTQQSFKIHSDKIITLMIPNQKIKELYLGMFK